MFVKVINVLLIIIIIFINYTQTVQPQKKDISRKKPQAQGDNKLKNIPQTNRFNKIKSKKPQSKSNQRNNVQKKAPTSKLNQGKNLSKRTPQINQRKNVPKNKPQPNSKQKKNTPIKLPPKIQRNNTPKSVPPNQRNNTPKDKPQTSDWNNIPKDLARVNPDKGIFKDTLPLSMLNERNYMQKYMLPINPWNDTSKNIPQKNQGNRVVKNILETQQTSQDRVPKDITPLKENQENSTINNTSQINNITENTPQHNKDNVKKKKWKFQDYLKKFEPKTIWEQIDKQRKYNKRQISEEEQMEIMIRGIDPTDEIMKLKIEDGDAKMIVPSDGRRGWKPGPKFHWYEKDKFHLRRRLYELMKQALYQARNKLITMQVYRDKYRRNGLYRMGFLFNKADNSANTFGKFSFRAFRHCLLKREAVDPPPLFDLLTINERQLNLWFNTEILVDLINKNDAICKAIFLIHKSSRQQIFDENFIDK